MEIHRLHARGVIESDTVDACMHCVHVEPVRGGCLERLLYFGERLAVYKPVETSCHIEYCRHTVVYLGSPFIRRTCDDRTGINSVL